VSQKFSSLKIIRRKSIKKSELDKKKEIIQLKQFRRVFLKRGLKQKECLFFIKKYSGFKILRFHFPKFGV